MMKYLSVGRISESLLALLSMKELSCSNINDVQRLSISYASNTRGALEFALQCHWISIEQDSYSVTDIGQNVLSMFDGKKISQELWMAIISSYIRNCRPSWGSLIPSGRKEAFRFMTNEERRCFNESGLLTDNSIRVIDWWDSIAKLYRNDSDNNLVQIGRKGEGLTIQYEQTRTSKSPIWASLDSNKLGYDIASFCSKESDDTLLIEVKSSEQSLPNASAIISRNEWNVALYYRRSKGYLFYFWLLSPSPKLAIINPDEMYIHAPSDSGVGKWKEFEVPFSAFSEKFIDV